MTYIYRHSIEETAISVGVFSVTLQTTSWPDGRKVGFAAIHNVVSGKELKIIPAELKDLTTAIAFIGEQWEQAGLFTPSIPEEE